MAKSQTLEQRDELILLALDAPREQQSAFDYACDIACRSKSLYFCYLQTWITNEHPVPQAFGGIYVGFKN